MSELLVEQRRRSTDGAVLEPERCGAPHSGLTYRVADTVELVQEAWGLVYRTYRRAHLIAPNPHGLHTTVKAVGPQIAVVVGQIDEATASTVTCIRDSAAGLPLSSAYGPELDSLRHDGARLTEVGLLADRRADLARTVDALFMLMHYAYDFAFLDGGTDMVIGVHPRHAGFYVRAFGFVVAGSERTYPVVNDSPVVLLRLSRSVQDQPGERPRGLRFFLDNPIDPAEFQERYTFQDAGFTNSSLHLYMNDRNTQPVGDRAAGA